MHLGFTGNEGVWMGVKGEGGKVEEKEKLKFLGAGDVASVLSLPYFVL